MEKATSIQHICDLLIKMNHQLEQHQQRESMSFLEEIHEHFEGIAGLNLTDVHVIDCIGRHEPINVTTLAERIELSKGTVSKVSTKLLKEGWIRRTQLNDNKKEIYFRLTPLGKKLFVVHERLHAKVQRQLFEFLSRYSSEELAVLKRLLSDGIGFLEAVERQDKSLESKDM
ncbi:MarR family transcriptional regulator [Paenibacillus kribbensis]|uniref:MarR family transcriptional regulator n=1 Tax=Paenibacillus kribbensis TaxID=172713 RepID=A0A222WUP1_9BACL|nr:MULTISPECIES: MarR family transcriptional regulator [Paenibacillus]ASR49481.1 MarR family transcriptional regulator [Paenibacillus kribbensis]EHS59678.1 transcriptional regulator yvmB [Paenibacillus sp. Aloe-11]MEC0234566.1 MarR family transcriptional regulator [Paenibacillus kribbensis]